MSNSIMLNNFNIYIIQVLAFFWLFGSVYCYSQKIEADYCEHLEKRYTVKGEYANTTLEISNKFNEIERVIELSLLSTSCSENGLHYLYSKNKKSILGLFNPIEHVLLEDVACMRLLTVNGHNAICETLPDDSWGGQYLINSINLNTGNTRLILETGIFGVSEGTFNISDDGRLLSGIFLNKQTDNQELLIIDLERKEKIKAAPIDNCITKSWFLDNDSLAYKCLDSDEINIINSD